MMLARERPGNDTAAPPPPSLPLLPCDPLSALR